MLEAASPVVDNYVNQAYRTLDLRDSYVGHINNKQYTAKSCLSSVPQDFHLWLFPKSYRPDNSVGMDRHMNIHWQLSHLHLDPQYQITMKRFNVILLHLIVHDNSSNESEKVLSAIEQISR